ncbi:methyltransferase domain-containing protein [Streptomyces sp. NPDC051162]|uniref:methyltransferase domain-containing protein n=1 Tax=Streptomyces sp. NPDC051162 TaxID=3154747 RepID=UPI003428AD4F
MADDAYDRELAAALRAGLVRELIARGELADPRWRAAFEQVPRELFVPYYYVGAPGGYRRRSRADPDPRAREAWLTGVYADEPLATYVRDGELISSSSQPSLMAKMLTALDLREGHAVLEIGAGTGYNAALLAHRLGDAAVTTVDLDAEITEAARAHLAEAGFHPTVVTGDGALGCASRAPFDRTMATCALPSVPPAWIAQSRPGALILAPLATGLIALRVTDAAHAEGRFLHTPAYFVPLRGAAVPPLPDRSGIPWRLLRNDQFQFLLAVSRMAPADALALWHDEGRPPRDRYGLTVAGGRQWAWLDSPDGPWRWPLDREFSPGGA